MGVFTRSGGTIAFFGQLSLLDTYCLQDTDILQAFSWHGFLILIYEICDGECERGRLFLQALVLCRTVQVEQLTRLPRRPMTP